MTTPAPEPDAQASEVDDQLAIDEADAAAGYRTVLDEEEGDELDPADPNRAVDHADDEDHEAYVGDPADDDDVAAVNRAVAEQGGAT